MKRRIYRFVFAFLAMLLWTRLSVGISLAEEAKAPPAEAPKAETPPAAPAAHAMRRPTSLTALRESTASHFRPAPRLDQRRISPAVLPSAKTGA